MPDIYDIPVTTLDGVTTTLEPYRGQVLLIVNTASQCGFTPQYEGLQKLYSKYKDQGLVVLGFPANNFMGQEPGTNEEIAAFCKRTYDVTFPMYSKISVKGEDQAPLYRFLTDKEANPSTGGDIRWNFTKFLVDRTGKVISRFESKIAPDNAEFVAAVEAALAKK